MSYNPWYSISYRHILEMANWDDLSADVTRKIVLVFSWMPQTIMAVTHAGRTRKYEYYDASSLESAIELLAPDPTLVVISVLRSEDTWKKPLSRAVETRRRKGFSAFQSTELCRTP